MAIIEHLSTGRRHELSSSHLVGKSPACASRLTNRLVSAEHAALRWNGTRWEVRDLASSNGTFVNDHSLDRGQVMGIEKGTRIAFGDAEDVFVVVDDSPPRACARTQDGTTLYEVDGVLALPTEDAYVFAVYEDAPGEWFVETRDGNCRRVEHQELLQDGESCWRLDLPVVIEQTARPESGAMRLGDIELRFEVSLDEEDVDLCIVHRRAPRPLKSRAHTYLLLTLARLREEDRKRGDLPEGAHGWVPRDDLLRMMSAGEDQMWTPERLNVEILRARRQFRRAKVLDAEELIERKRGKPYKLRLGVARVEIETHGRKRG